MSPPRYSAIETDSESSLPSVLPGRNRGGSDAFKRIPGDYSLPQKANATAATRKRNETA
jgi:hypothetical protein